jgi:capsular exopolysaccharide synthesis family protein
MIVDSQTNSFSQDIRRYISLFWQWAWLLVLVFLLVGGATYYYYWQKPPVYQTSSTLIINEAPGTQTYDVSAVSVSERLVDTYIEIMTNKTVLEEVIVNLELDMGPSALKNQIAIQQIRETPLIRITVRDSDPYRAANIANEIGSVFAIQNQLRQEARYASSKISLQRQLEDLQPLLDALETELAALGDAPENEIERDQLDIVLTQYRQTYAQTLQSYEQVRLKEADALSNVISVEDADPPNAPIRPNILQQATIGGMMGAMLIAGIIYLRDALDDTIHVSDDISRFLDLPVLGVIRKIDGTQPVITAIKPRSPAAEDFRSLRTNIQFASVDIPLRTILVTSPTPGDGKTVISTNLSIVLAQGGQRVSLIDADLRRPRVHEYMQIPNRWGLTYLFTSQENNLDGVLRKNKSLGLSIMTSGNTPPNPAELLGSEKMRQIIYDIQTQSDAIVFDSPPLNAVTDASVLSKMVDGVILVVRAETTKILAAQQAVEQLRRVGANVIGVVLNNVNMSRARNYTYYAYYSDYIESVEGEKKRKNHNSQSSPKTGLGG